MKDSTRQPVADDSAPPGGGPDSVDRQFAANVRDLREKAGMTQADLAGKMAELGWKYHRQTVHKIENGQQKVGVGEAAALAGVLGTTLTRLTQPDPASNTAVFIEMFTGRAGSAFEQIASWTSALLFARDHIEQGIETAEKQALDSDRVREAVADGVAALENATPEAAVKAGAEDYARDYGDDK